RSCRRSPTVTARAVPSAVTTASRSLFFRPKRALFQASSKGNSMLRKLGVAGLVAGAAFGAVLAGTPASAHSGDNSFEQESVVVSGQECEASLASGVLALNIPILSPQSNGNCESGAVGGNSSEYVFVLSSDKGVVPSFFEG